MSTLSAWFYLTVRMGLPQLGHTGLHPLRGGAGTQASTDTHPKSKPSLLILCTYSHSLGQLREGKLPHPRESSHLTAANQAGVSSWQSRERGAALLLFRGPGTFSSWYSESAAAAAAD